MKRFEYDSIPPVRIKQGLLKGYYFDHSYIFKGVPYAQARRFHMPEPPQSWDGVREATTYGYICPQTSDMPGDELLTAHRLWYQDEHCHNLNIWTPSIDRDAKRPVIVWLHGGGYIFGSSLEQLVYDGKNLSQYGDAVVVSINERVGILGYLDLSKHGKEYSNSCNAGHADIVAALRWIHENIEAFGGDPENVTLFGQSGGGMKIIDLLQIPAADGLFHKALIMSGINSGNISPLCTGDGSVLTDIILQELGIPLERIEKLEQVPFEQLLKCYQKHLPEFYMTGYAASPVKNDFFYGNPIIYGLREHAYEVPLMIGSVLCEFDPWLRPDDRAVQSETAVIQIIAKKYGERAAQMKHLFHSIYPDKNPVNVVSLDRAIRPDAVRFARMHAKGKRNNTYMFNFTLNFPYQNNKAAWHCSDIPFFFHNTELSEISNIEGVTDQLEGQMSGALIAFAKTGNPSHEGIPKWPHVTPQTVPTMIFDKKCCVRFDYDDALYSLIDEIMPPFSNLDLVGDRL